MPLIITVSFVFIAIFCLVFGFVRILIGDQLVLKDRLHHMEITMTQKYNIGFKVEVQADFSTRILRPISSKTSV
ncbi:MAG: hypothetical protein GX133_08410, partial [Syntrophomonadaceae bacterium]|nr:hypothetical protein [Syntrophomonadaceae bacterium]